jgi:hypothetical protein
MASLEKLYKNYDLLNDLKADATKREVAFKEILSAVKGDTKLKQLACQFIVKFASQFPKLQDEAVDAQIDLCEDEEPIIRRYAIKELPNFCKDSPDNVLKISDILAQLMETEDSVELHVVQGSLFQLLKANPKECMAGIFQHLSSDVADDNVKERNCKLIASKLPLLSETQLTAEVEKFIFDTSREMMKTAGVLTFAGLLGILSALKCGQQLRTRLQLLEIIGQRAGVDKSAAEFTADKNAISTFYLCTNQALSFFSKNVKSSKFVNCICEKILPVFSTVSATQSPTKSELLKLLAELSPNVHVTQLNVNSLQQLYKLMTSSVPGSLAEATGDEDETLMHAECIIYAFHNLASHNKDFLAATDAAARVAECRKRLQFYALMVQSQKKKHDEKITELVKSKGDADEINKLKMKVTRCNNITALVKDFFHSPPQYLSEVTLSWKKSTEPQKEQTGPVKRPLSGAPTANGTAPKPAKVTRPVYRSTGGRGGGARGAGGNVRGRGGARF